MGGNKTAHVYTRQKTEIWKEKSWVYVGERSKRRVFRER